MTLTGALVAHQGGWDEILLVAGPIVVIVVLLGIAKRRVERGVTGLDTAHDTAADTGAVAPPDTSPETTSDRSSDTTSDRGGADDEAGTGPISRA